MAKFDPSKDKILATMELILDTKGAPVGNPATKVEQPDKESGHTRYRLTVAAYNGGQTKLRRQSVYQTKDGEDRVNAAGSVPLAHVAMLSKAAAGFVAKVQAAAARRKAG